MVSTSSTGGAHEVQYIVSARGGLQLCVDGYRYTRDRIKDNGITYRCVHYKPLGCKARAKTDKDKSKLRVIDAEHNHPRNMDRRKSGALRKLLEERKREHQETVVTRTSTRQTQKND
ncbi:uncharacterized protein LOC135697501 [Ochlerotatus camptorhynchus]|uniref:uncharacterized protein LOC135697501 n=1 Tax=Ochlerotatus camptorhynchus TaxID=644619 RepID=UPI0031DD227E